MKKIIASLIVVLLFSSVTYGASTLKSISVSPNIATLKVDGKIVNADNFIYNGTTYVPLRAISENLSCDVAWDQTTKTATITSSSQYENNSNVNDILGFLYDYNITREVVSGMISYSDLAMSLYAGNLSSDSNIKALEDSLAFKKIMLSSLVDRYIGASPRIMSVVASMETMILDSEKNLSYYKASRRSTYDAQIAWNVEKNIHSSLSDLMVLEINPKIKEMIDLSINLTK